jgi:hypothetical protein
VTTWEDDPAVMFTCPGCGVETGPPVPALRDHQAGAFCSYRCWLYERDDAPSFVRPGEA